MNYKYKVYTILCVVVVLFILFCRSVFVNIDIIYNLITQFKGLDIYYICNLVNLTYCFCLIAFQAKFYRLRKNKHVQRLEKYGYLKIDFIILGIDILWYLVYIISNIACMVKGNTLILLAIKLNLLVAGVILFIYWLCELKKLIYCSKDLPTDRENTDTENTDTDDIM